MVLTDILTVLMFSGLVTSVLNPSLIAFYTVIVFFVVTCFVSVFKGERINTWTMAGGIACLFFLTIYFVYKYDNPDFVRNIVASLVGTAWVGKMSFLDHAKINNDMISFLKIYIPISGVFIALMIYFQKTKIIKVQDNELRTNINILLSRLTFFYGKVSAVLTCQQIHFKRGSYIVLLLDQNKFITLEAVRGRLMELEKIFLFKILSVTLHESTDTVAILFDCKAFDVFSGKIRVLVAPLKKAMERPTQQPSKDTEVGGKYLTASKGQSVKIIKIEEDHKNQTHEMVELELKQNGKDRTKS